MSFQNLVVASREYFPNLKIKYKNQSWFMKLLGKLLFFNKPFMTSFTTTIGEDIYFPSETYTRARPISAGVVLLHELVHVKDNQKFKLLFGFLYLFPQILALLCLPLLLLSWKIALPLMILFALPIPSYFRMHFEKRAYLVSLYCLYHIGKLRNFDPKLESQSKSFLKHFNGSHYYFMWPFKNLEQEFDKAVIDIKNGKRPFEDPIFDILDNLIPKI